MISRLTARHEWFRKDIVLVVISVGVGRACRTADVCGSLVDVIYMRPVRRFARAFSFYVLPIIRPSARIAHGHCCVGEICRSAWTARTCSIEGEEAFGQITHQDHTVSSNEQHLHIALLDLSVSEMFRLERAHQAAHPRG